MSHTPGPWTVWAEHYEVYAGEVTLNTPGNLRGKNTQRVADCDPVDLSEVADEYDAFEQAAANAHLIAAAPDLLEACKEVLIVNGWGDDYHETGTTKEERTAEMLAMVRAAIARAEGGAA